MRCTPIKLKLCNARRVLLCDDKVILVYRDESDFRKDEECARRAGGVALEERHNILGIGVVEGDELIEPALYPDEPEVLVPISTKVLITLYKAFGKERPEDNIYQAFIKLGTQ